MEFVEPRISKRDRKLHLSYDLPHRVHCSTTYSLPSPDGADIIIYGNEEGIRVLWRGGRRQKRRSGAPHSNGYQSGHGAAQNQDGDDEEDRECSYPKISPSLDLPYPAAVLHIAVPYISPALAPQLPPFVREHAIVAVACADSTVSLCSFSLEPPTGPRQQLEARTMQLHGDGGICRSLACKLILPSESGSAAQTAADAGDPAFRSVLLIAGVGESVPLWSIGLTAEGFARSSSRHVLIREPARGVAFASPVSSSLLALYDHSGSVRMCTVSGRSSLAGRSHSLEAEESPRHPHIQWLMTYQTPFETANEGQVLPKRKRVLDMAWILNGRAIMVLLADGQWGVWDIYAKNQQDFAMHGYLTASASEQEEAGKQKKESTKLAPMTPNTRKAKSENLFSRPAKASTPRVAPRGGISVTPSSGPSGTSDEGVTIWFNGDVYSFPSMNTFWQRNSSNSGGLGSLYAPGLSHVSGINVMDENITGISQLTSNAITNELGRMNIARPLVVSAEHRIIFFQPSSPPAPKNDLFQNVAVPSTTQDQRMLDAGELDLGGMDRMLDSIAGGYGRTRRVGFVS